MRRKLAALRNIGIDRDARALGEFECDYPVELIHGCAHRFLGESVFEGGRVENWRAYVRVRWQCPSFSLRASVRLP